MISKANENQLLYRLYCGDDYIIHFNPTDDDPWYPGEGRKVAKEPSKQSSCLILKVGLTRLELAEYGGWYDGSNWLPSKKMNEQRSELFCGEDTNAFTLPQFRSITWCPLAFLGYYGDSHGLKPSTTFIKQKQNRIKSHEQLSNYYSLASVWIHEWTHLQSGTRDQPAYDADSNIIVNEDSYGYYYCANLARKIANPANPGDDPNGPDTQSGKSLAIANADNYAYFALAMYLNEWDWGEGIALNRFGF